MRDFAVSVILITLMSVGIFINSSYVEKRSDSLINDIDMLYSESEEITVYELRDKWNRDKRFFGISANYDFIYGIDNSICSAIAYFESGSSEEYKTALACAKNGIEELRLYEKISFDRIL